MRNLIIIGGGGHAKVIADIAIANKYNILGFLDDNPNNLEFLGLNRLGCIADALKYSEKAKFIIAIGNNKIRKKINEKYRLNYATLIHPSAIVGSDVAIGEGSVIMPNTVINTSTKIGKHCIINTCASVDHDNLISDFTHISPNATLCGTVKIGENCHVGAGATIINNINIFSNCTIGAGAVVTSNIENSGIYVGVPAKKIR